MLALPLQGYAGTHMLMCSADAGAPAPRALPCHGDSAQPAHHAVPRSDHRADHHADRHDAAKPGSCAACSLLAPMATAAVAPLALDGPASTAIPFRAPRLPSVDPVLPDRPPCADAA